MEEIPGCPERGGKPNVCKHCKGEWLCSDMARDEDLNYPAKHGHRYIECATCSVARENGVRDYEASAEYWALRNKYKGRTRKFFVEAIGPTQYKQIKRKEQAWRIAYTLHALCEIAGCNTTGDYGSTFVFDHCHTHGWVRGLVCTSHNVRLGHIDSVRRIPNVKLDLSNTEYQDYLNNCSGCVTENQTKPALTLIAA